MRDVYKEYKQGLISWDKAFCIANNKAALGKGDTDYWADQMNSLGCDAAERIMALLGYTHDEEGIYIKPMNHTKNEFNRRNRNNR